MAYRGDTTDPLEVIIQQRRAQRQVVLWMVLMWVLSAGIRGVFRLGEMNSRAAQSAPARGSRLQTPASGTQPMVASDGKMSAFALERWLSTAPSSSHAPHDVQCMRAPTGWDYICSYANPGPTPTRLKIGVRVSANSVVQASQPQKYDSMLPPPSAAR